MHLSENIQSIQAAQRAEDTELETDSARGTEPIDKTPKMGGNGCGPSVNEASLLASSESAGNECCNVKNDTSLEHQLAESFVINKEVTESENCDRKNKC